MNASDEFFARHLSTTPVLAILRGVGVARTLELCERAWRLGISLVEIPVQNDVDRDALEAAVAAGRADGNPVGAGTVVSVDLVRSVADAGAAFTVAPGLDESVAEASLAAGLPHLPGVATASEIHHAVQLGMHWQKAFPAAALGPGWISAMGGPFPHVRLVATGGVDAGNARAFLDAGAAAVSLGSSFAESDPDLVRELTGAA